MEATATSVKIVGPEDGSEGFLGSIGVRFMIDGSEAGERFSLVEHPMSPRALAAPLHLHTREDEYSFVLEGRMGALLGDDVVEAGPGDLVFKPRNQWHTFWNAGDEPCRILEIISPAGFERFFRELVDMGGVLQADPEALGAAERALRPRDPARDGPGAARALRPADRRAALRRLDASIQATPEPSRPREYGPAGRLARSGPGGELGPASEPSCSMPSKPTSLAAGGHARRGLRVRSG